MMQLWLEIPALALALAAAVATAAAIDEKLFIVWRVCVCVRVCLCALSSFVVVVVLFSKRNSCSHFSSLFAFRWRLLVFGACVRVCVCVNGLA